MFALAQILRSWHEQRFSNLRDLHSNATGELEESITWGGLAFDIVLCLLSSLMLGCVLYAAGYITIAFIYSRYILIS
jgi:hypothetical protein